MAYDHTIVHVAASKLVGDYLWLQRILVATRGTAAHLQVARNSPPFARFDVLSPIAVGRKRDGILKDYLASIECISRGF